MQRKIKVEQLQPGMYIEKLDRSWLNVPIFRKRITSAEQVKQLIGYNVREVVIDTEKGMDLPGDGSREPEPKVVESSRPYLEEVVAANQVYDRALDVVSQVMDAVRQGQQPELEPVSEVVEGLIATLLRNRYAVTSLVNLREHSDTVYQHCLRVCVMSLAVGHRQGMTRDELKVLGMGAILHDAGKMRLPQELVDKTTPMSEGEYRKFKNHPVLGAKLLNNSPGIGKRSLMVMLQHHERCDGTGYPMAMVEEEISDLAKIVMIADTYDKLTQRDGMLGKLSPYEAVDWLGEWGRQEFSPSVMQAFVDALGLYPVGSLVRLSDNRLAIVMGVHQDAALLPRVWVVSDEEQRLLPVGEMVELAAQESANPVTVDVSLQPEKMGFDLHGYARSRGLLDGSLGNRLQGKETHSAGNASATSQA